MIPSTDARRPVVAPPVVGRARLRPGVALVTAAVLSVLIIVRALPAMYGLPLVGLVAAWGAPPDTVPTARLLFPSPRNVAIGSLIVAAFAVVALQHRLLRALIVTFGAGRQSIIITLLSVAVLMLPLAMAESPIRIDDLPAHRVVMTKRNLLLALTGLIAVATSHATVGQTFVVLAVLVPGLPVVLAASRLRHARHGRVERGLWRRPLRGGLVLHRLQLFNLLLFSALLGIAMLTRVFDVLRLYLPVGGYRVFQAAFFVGLVALVILALVPLSRVYIGTNVLVAAGSIFLALQLVMIYQPAFEPTIVESPLGEEWYVDQGGHAELVNYHYVTSAQRDALDIVQIVDGRSHPGGSTDLSSYYIFGAPLLAPADGIVTSVVDGLADQQIGSTDRENAAGNHVVIDISGGRYILLAHARQGSVRVAVGDRITAGQTIAEVGNSGGSTEPHIHIQAFNLPSFELAATDLAELLRTARTFPLVFQGVVLTRNGSESMPTTVDPRRGDLIRPAP